jgi:uncharacterized protein (DUF486 family)
MATLSTRSTGSSSVASTLCLIVGLACLAGFAVDAFILLVPPRLGSVEWRVNVVQQLSDRSIVLLFGAALVFYGSLASRSWKRLISLLCLALGVMYILSSVVILRDSNVLHKQVINRIDNQANQIQTQIDQAQTNPGAAPQLTPEVLQEASDRLATQSNQLKENSKQSILKSGISTIGNLLVIGVSFLSLGLLGSKMGRI